MIEDADAGARVLATLEQHGTPVAYSHARRTGQAPIVARRIMRYVDLTRYHRDGPELRETLRQLEDSGLVEWRPNGDVLTRDQSSDR